MFIGQGILSLLVHPDLSTVLLVFHNIILDLSGIDLSMSSPLPIFRPLVFHRSTSSYTLRSGKFSYATGIP